MKCSKEISYSLVQGAVFNCLNALPLICFYKKII